MNDLLQIGKVTSCEKCYKIMRNYTIDTLMMQIDMFHFFRYTIYK